MAPPGLGTLWLPSTARLLSRHCGVGFPTGVGPSGWKGAALGSVEVHPHQQKAVCVRQASRATEGSTAARAQHLLPGARDRSTDLHFLCEVTVTGPPAPHKPVLGAMGCEDLFGLQAGTQVGEHSRGIQTLGPGPGGRPGLGAGQEGRGCCLDWPPSASCPQTLGSQSGGARPPLQTHRSQGATAHSTGVRPTGP